MSVEVSEPLRIGFVLHVMQVAGAEVLVAETIRRLGGRIAPVVFCLDGVGALGERMRAEGVPVITLDRKPGLDPALPGRFAEELDRHDVELLHAHQYTPFFYSALAKLRRRRRAHLMFTEHGRHFPDVVSAKRRLFNRFVLSRLADEVNGVSEFSVRSLAEVDGFGGRRLEVIPNGIDPHRYAQGTRDQAKRRIGLDPSRRAIACVARFHPIKDHAMLIDAFAQVARTSTDVDLVLAGDGPLRTALVERVASHGMAGRVHFLGVRSDVPDVLRAADIFALTSICEAASITLLEAMASELPVVVTNVGGNPELVQHGEQGFLVPRGDAKATAAAFERLLSDPVLAARLGEAGRGRVVSHYRLDATVEAYWDRYARAVAEVRADERRPTAIPA